MTRSAKKHFRIIKEAREEWKNINKKALEEAIGSLYKSNLLTQKNNGDGTVTFILSRDGKRRALTYNIDNMVISTRSWDKVWRIVIFDIPERLKKVRDTLRHQLKRLGFIELQRSVFVLPYECKDQIEYITEFHSARRYIRYIEARHIDNELDLEHKFNLR